MMLAAVESGRHASAMTYSNTHRTTLAAVSASGLIGGALIWLIATALIAKEANSEFGPSLEALASAGGWQGAGASILAVGVLAFLALCVTGSISYDLRFHATPSVEPENADS